MRGGVADFFLDRIGVGFLVANAPFKGLIKAPSASLNASFMDSDTSRYLARSIDENDIIKMKNAINRSAKSANVTIHAGAPLGIACFIMALLGGLPTRGVLVC